MSQPIHAFDFLAKPHAPSSLCVLFGDDRFLKSLVLKKIRAAVCGEEEDAVGPVELAGDTARWRDIADQLDTVSLFGEERRLVVVDEAAKFVSNFRSQLEDYLDHPSSVSLLVLNVVSWPGNTRLYKSVGKSGLAIDCGPPQRTAGKRKELDPGRLIQWLSQRSEQHHQAKLPGQAADQLLELVGPNVGLLDQELAKLAVLAGVDGTITSELVIEVVGGWRAKTSWQLLDAATDGNAAEALGQLDRLLTSGEPVQALFGAISWSLRRFADATRIVEHAERNQQRVNLLGALEKAGFRSWPRHVLETAERQLRQIGRERASHLYQWLLEADLALKGTHSSPERARLVIEKLIIRLAKQARPRPGSRIANC